MGRLDCVRGRFLGSLFFSHGLLADVLVPDFGDLNCEGFSNVVDVQLAIVSALDLPVNGLLDTDGDGIPDPCQDYANAVSGDCAQGQVIQWNGMVWACAVDEEAHF
jgi:hypothetical protein